MKIYKRDGRLVPFDQNKIIDAMCQYIASLDNEETICCKTKRYNNCDPMSLGECEQCIREYFEHNL